MLARDLYARVNSQADFAPQATPGWLKYVSDTINEVYSEIWYSRVWTFNTKSVELPVYPDMSAAQALNTFMNTTDVDAVPLTVIVGQTFATLTTTGAIPTFYSSVANQLLEQLTGASIEIEGRDYTIVDYKITDNGSTWDIRFYLDLPFIGAYADSTDVEFTDWKLKFKSYKLPEDCVDVLDISWSNMRDPGGLRIGQSLALAPRLAHDMGLNMQLSSAKPSSYIPVMTTFQGDTFQDFTVTQTASTGTAFPVGTYYFAWEIVDMVTGASSGLTQAITVNVTATNTINLIFADDRTLSVGTYRRLLIGVARRSGDMIQWFYADYFPTTSVVAKYDPDSPFIWRSESTTKTLTYANYLTAANLSGSERGGGYRGQTQTHYIGNNDRRQVIFYPRLSTVDFDRESDTSLVRESIATIRYVSKCAPIVDQYDSPQIPAEFQHLIVFKALESVCLKFDKPAQASYYANKYKEQYTLLVRRYSNDLNVIARKGNSMGIGIWGYSRPFSVTYQG